MPRLCRPFLTLLLLALLGNVGASIVATSPAAASDASDEAGFLVVTNQARAAAGLLPLTADPRAAAVAKAWSQSMAAAGSLSHNPSLVTQIASSVTKDWTRIGENVGVGGDVATLQNAFMNSPPHRANVLGDYNRVGIGAVRDGSGRLWITLDFVKGPALVVGSPPVGNVDGLTSDLNGVHVWGWTFDPDTSASASVHIYADGGWLTQLTASDARPDVAAVYPSYGPGHGFSARLSLPAGFHTVCVYAIDIGGPGVNPALGCRVVYVNRAPTGRLDGLALRPGGVAAYGWAVDPDTAASIGVHAYVNLGWAGAQTANLSRPDVGSSFPTFGSAHGFSAFMGLKPGPNLVCIYGINSVGPEPNTAAGCGSVYWTGTSFGNLDRTVVSGNDVRVAGWSIDPDTQQSTLVHIYVDGGWGGAIVASQARSDVAAAYAGYGSAHGYDTTMRMAPGTHTLCAFAINTVGAGANPLLGCKVVTV